MALVNDVNERKVESTPGQSAGRCDVALVNDVNERKVVVVGVLHHAEVPELVGPVQSLLERKQVSLKQGYTEATRWSLLSWSTITAQDAVSELRGRKYFPEVYVERPGIDDKIAEVLERSGRGLLLLGEAGYGKSSLLARLVERLPTERPKPKPPGSRKQHEKRHRALASLDGYLDARDEGDLVLFLSGRGAYGGPSSWDGRELLCKAVLNQAGIKSEAFSSLAEFLARLNQTAADDRNEERRVWLILDALNEADRFTDLVVALDEFLPALDKYTWLRLVVSMRSGAYHSLRQRHHDELRHGPAVFANARYWTPFDDDETKQEQPYLQLRPLTLEEGRQAYRLRQAHLPERSTGIPWEEVPAETRHLLCTPLYLHLFHEAYRGRTVVPATLDAAQLAETYLDALIRDMEGIASWLNDLGTLLYETRQAMLPMTVADDWLDEWRKHIKDPRQWHVKLDPLEELVAASLLLRPAELEMDDSRRLQGYVFTHQKLCEQIMLRELLRRIRPRALPTGPEFLEWARRAAGADGQNEFRELTGALTIVAARLVAAGQGEVLAVLLDLGHDSVCSQVLGAALRALGPHWGKHPHGEPVPAGVLAALFETARTDPFSGERFYHASKDAQTWLRQSGYSRCAWALGEGRLAVWRGLTRNGVGDLEWQQEYASCLTELAKFAVKLGDWETAGAWREEALVLLERLANVNPQRLDLQLNLAVALRERGLHFNKLIQGRAASPFFDRAITLLRGLSALDPARQDVRLELAVSLSANANYLRGLGQSEDAVNGFSESIGLLEGLIAADPARSDLKLEMSIRLNYLGEVNMRLGRTDDALVLFERSLAIRKDLVDKNPQRMDFRHRLAMSLSELGVWAKVTGHGEQSQHYFEQSLQLRQYLVRQEPHLISFKAYLSKPLQSLCRRAMATGRDLEARSYLEQSGAIRLERYDKETKVREAKGDYATYVLSEARLAVATGHESEARQYFARSLEVRRAAITAEPDRQNAHRALADVLREYGGFLADIGDYEGSLTLLEEAVSIHRMLLTVQPGRADWRRGLALALRDSGYAHGFLGERESGRERLDEAESILRGLEESESSRIENQYALALTLIKKGALARDGAQEDTVCGFFLAAVERLDRLIALDPARVDFRLDLADACWDLYSLADRDSGKVHWLRRMKDTLRDLREREMQRPRLENLWSRMSEALGTLTADIH